MSGAASVNIKEIDLSTRVASFEGVFGAIVVPAKKGPSDVPFFVSSDTQFLNVFTPDSRVEVGYDQAYFSSLAYLERANKLWVKRAINGAFFAGLVIGDASIIDVAASFDGAIAGVTGNVQLSADTAGTGGNAILITGDGIKTLTVLVSDWNTANPTNAVTLDSANGADVPTDLEAMQLANGIDASVNAAVTAGSDIADPSAYVMDAEDALFIHASSEGTWGDSIGVKIINAADDVDDNELAADALMFRIEIYKSSNQAVPVETYYCSRTLGHKDGRGRNVFVEDVLEGSNYVRAISNVTVDEAISPKSQTTILFMADGDDGSAVTDSNMITAANVFTNKAAYSVTLLLDGGYTVPAYQIALDTIAQGRLDCVAILSTPYSAEAASTYMTDLVDYRKSDLNLNSSYSALYTPHVQIPDRFNDRKIYVSPDGYVGGSISFAANNYEIWFPPAGNRRGVLNVLDLRRRFEDGELDLLANAGINPIKFGKGFVVWGQKTLLQRASALDRLNVRLLLIVIEPAIQELLEDYLFELNEAGVRSIIETKIETYLEGIKSRKGVTDYDVVADESNNSADDIENNRLNVDIFIKPTRSIEEIPMRVVITPTNISFSEAAGAI